MSSRITFIVLASLVIILSVSLGNAAVLFDENEIIDLRSPFVINVNSGDTAADGNASSICSGIEVLLGNGSCHSISLLGGADSNETNRVGVMVASDCTAGTLVIGIQDNGTLLCASDASGGAAGLWNASFNVTFDQRDRFTTPWNSSFNTTFASLDQTSSFTAWNSSFNITFTSLDSNETVRFGNLVTSDCTAGNLVIGVQDNGTVLCAADSSSAFIAWNSSFNTTFSSLDSDTIFVPWNASFNTTFTSLDSGAAGNPFNQVLNTTSNVSFRILNITNGSGNLGLYADGDGKVGINTALVDMLDSFTVTDGMNLIHNSIESGDHAFEIDFNASGFGDAKAIFIDYITGDISSGEDEEVILINIDKFLSTGGHVTGIEIVSTEGGADVTAMEVGILVDPISQLVGVFGDMDSALNNTDDVLASFVSTASDVTIFESDNEIVTIGNAAKFEEIEFILDTVASGAGIKPKFYYSTGIGDWTEFSPSDGTNGMKNNGVIIWGDTDIPSWVIGTGSEFLIRINRTQNSLSTAPVEDKVQISSAVEYHWDKNGTIRINSVNASNNISAAFFLGDGSLLSNLPSGVNDGNASSICTGPQVLLGNGTCQEIGIFLNDTTSSFTAWNASFNTTFASLDVDTVDGNASSICADERVLLGNGSCHQIGTFLNDTTSSFTAWNASFNTTFDSRDRFIIPWNSSWNATFASLDQMSSFTPWNASFNTTFASLDNTLDNINITYRNNTQTFTAVNTFSAEPLFTTGINITAENNLTVGNSRTWWNGSCLNTEVGGTLVSSIGCQ